MSTHKIGIYEGLTKIIFQLLSNIIKYAPYLEGLAQNYCICILHIFQEKQKTFIFSHFCEYMIMLDIC